MTLFWGDLTSAPHWRRVLQRAYLGHIEALIQAEKTPDAAARKKVKDVLVNQLGLTNAFAAVATSTGANTVFTGWSKDMLPKLAKRLDAAAADSADPDDKFYFIGMASRSRQIATQFK